ncbi:hypothetical protein GXP67_09385 [Rhodocytophaga rosea]|uniref:Signal transduction histidine kinase internal region domain-containing protein n=1 Tax=Rhodocytophaga rosea TaxID=2704465 RepID=A0A6C0GGA1_9BACT|nr:histidine kinase [Rhodocytophaga rosea]QHT66854.1 hypothetical protein GXP67_09385 [Rhodocytophaga rosea]
MKRLNVTGVHILLWVGYILLYATVWRAPEISFGNSLLRELSFLPLKIVLVYTCIFFLVPRYLQSKQYGMFIFATVMIILVTTILYNTYLQTVVPALFIEIKPDKVFFDWEKVSKRMTFLTSPMFFGLTLTMVRNWYDQREQNAMIMQENLNAKLHLLKQQLQPHFFFNTLNSLYSLALQKSDQTPVMILKLSELMRYLSDHQSSDWVRLKDEICFLENYLSIEEIRYQDKASVTITNAIASSENIYIPPLVLSTFVENAFKHGVSPSLNPAFVAVEINEDAQYICYKVSNSKAPLPHKQAGTGLANLHARLKIIYGKNFNMDIVENENLYSAELKLKKEIENVYMHNSR